MLVATLRLFKLPPYSFCPAWVPRMQDRSPFSIAELLGCALLLACGLVALVYTLKLAHDLDGWGALQGAGLAIALLVAALDPAYYFVGGWARLASRRSRPSRQNRWTLAASMVGVGLSVVGWLVEMYFAYFGN
jgi:hypothetical protein